MNNDENMLDLISKTDDDITWYLEDVSIEQFKIDVLEIAIMNTDKKMIEEAIKKLQSLL